MGCIHDLQVCVLCLSEINSCTLDKLKEEEIEDGKKKQGIILGKSGEEMIFN